MRLLDLMLAGIAGSVVLITVTRSTLFRPLRSKLDERSVLLGDLIHCPYCFGHWVGWLLAALLKLRLFPLHWLLNWFFSGLVVAWLSIILGVAVFQAAKHITLPKEEP